MYAIRSYYASPPLASSRLQPRIDKNVAAPQSFPGLSPRKRYPRMPAAIGELPIPTIVPTATPVFATPTKKQS